VPILRAELRSGGDHVYTRELDGVYDLSDIALARIESGGDDLGNASLTGDKSFTGTKTLKEAVRLCNEGWPEGVESVSEVLEGVQLDPALLMSANRIESYFDVAGDEPDIDRFLVGDPENMVVYTNGLQTHGTILDIVLNVGQHAYVDKQEIINRGASVLAAVEALRAHGYSIGVMAVERCSGSRYYYDNSPNKIMQYSIPILAPGEAVNVDTLAFSTMHPSFLRRLLFAANEAEPDSIRRTFGYMRGGGYGRPLPLEGYTHARPAYIIDKDDWLTRDKSKVAEYAQKIAENCLHALDVHIDTPEKPQLAVEDNDDDSDVEGKSSSTSDFKRKLYAARKSRGGIRFLPR
jgi:hypothetical protein